MSNIQICPYTVYISPNKVILKGEKVLVNKVNLTNNEIHLYVKSLNVENKKTLLFFDNISEAKKEGWLV